MSGEDAGDQKLFSYMLSALMFSGPVFGVLRPLIPYLLGGEKFGDDADDIDLTGGFAEKAKRASFMAQAATGTLSEEQKAAARASFTGQDLEDGGEGEGEEEKPPPPLKCIAVKVMSGGASQAAV